MKTDPQHLDEGTLRAYLDDTADGRKSSRHDVLRHLAVCAPCRARLDAARLGDQPLVETGTTWSPPQFSRVTVGALAGTVALILGMGWYLRSAPTPSGALDDATSPPRPLPVRDTRATPPESAVVATPVDTPPPVAQAVESLPPAATPIIPAPPAPQAMESLTSPVPTGIPAPAPLPWINVTAGTAGQRIGGPMALLPDLPLIRIAVSSAEPAMARFSYRLGPEIVVALVQEWITAVGATRSDSIAASAADSGLSTASTDWRGYRLTVVGPLPADSLYGLLRRLPQP